MKAKTGLVSVVTVSYNSEETIKETIDSVNRQSYEYLEHIFIDGGSQDNTVGICFDNSCRINRIISEDDEGLYDAMNKGYHLSSGEIIIFLNSDDTFSSDYIIEKIVKEFKKDIDIVYGDINMVDKEGKIRRKWISEDVTSDPDKLIQLPFPAMAFRAQSLERVKGPLDKSYKISADLKLQLIMIKKLRMKCVKLPLVFVEMKLGGESTKSINNIIHGWRESYSAYQEIFGRGALYFVFKKILSKFKSIRL